MARYVRREGVWEEAGGRGLLRADQVVVQEDTSRALCRIETFWWWLLHRGEVDVNDIANLDSQ